MATTLEDLDRRVSALEKADVAGIKVSIANLRTEMKTDIAAVRTELAGVRTELKGEIADLRGEVRAMPATIMNRMMGLMTVQVAFFAAILLAALQLWPRG